MKALAETIKCLQDSEINCGLQTFFDGNHYAWLGDDMNGKIMCPNPLPIEEMGQWLHDQALQQYPNSLYALSFASGDTGE